MRITGRRLRVAGRVAIGATMVVALHAQAATPDRPARHVDRAVRAAGGTVSYVLREVGAGVIYARNADHVQEPASAIKTLHLVHTLLALDRKQVRLTDWIDVPSSYVQGTYCPVTPPRVGGAADSAAYRKERVLTVLQRMMRRSDNDATEAIRMRFGQEALNRTATGLRLRATRVLHAKGCTHAGVIGQYDTSTVADLATLYSKALATNLLRPATRSLMRSIMLGNSYYIRHVIADEARRTFRAAVPSEFWAHFAETLKEGSYASWPPSWSWLEQGADAKSPPGSPAPRRAYRTTAGWVQLPFRVGGASPRIELRQYVYGLFLDSPESPAAYAAYAAGYRELLRQQVRLALGTFLTRR